MVIKLREMRWSEHVASMGKTRSAYKIFNGNSETKTSLGAEISVEGKLIFQWILNKQDVDKWPGFNCLVIGYSDRML
jgi:hypothetical protein